MNNIDVVKLNGKFAVTINGTVVGPWLCNEDSADDVAQWLSLAEISDGTRWLSLSVVKGEL